MVSVKQALEKLYVGRCDVYEYPSVKDPVTKITKQQEVKVHTAKPCRLSFKSAPAATQSDSASSIKQVTTLFIDPALVIKAGSKIVVTQNGVTKAYTRSGEPMWHTNHQELVLDLFSDWT